jgi:hypothetical protein
VDLDRLGDWAEGNEMKINPNKSKFVCECVLYYCHQVATQLQLTNISYHIKNVCSGCSYGCAPNIVNVPGRGLTLPGRPEVDPAVTVFCHLQLLYSVKGLWWQGSFSLQCFNAGT